MEHLNRRSFALSLAGLPLASVVSAPTPSVEPSGRSSSNKARTFSHVGKELRPFAQLVEATLAEQDGHGFLNHLWFGGDFPGYVKTRLRIYVDGEPTPSIDMEMSLGAGVGFSDPAAPWGTRWAGITGAPSGLFLNYRVPFSRHIRITAELPPSVPRDTVFWWIARGLLNHPADISGFVLPERARLRLHKNVDLTVKPLELFDLCKVTGQGMVFQVTMAAQSTNFEFMEGQMRAFIDGANEPMYLSSGLEDYFLGTYYFNRGLYHLPQGGLTHKDDAHSSFSAYRFHDIDPVLFGDGLRLTCRCGEMLGIKIAGPTGSPQPTTYTTYAWVYEW
jgi:hypothetical protein